MSQKPNILVFMTDHQRADTVLSEHPAQTPNLTRLAEQGLTFTNAFCPSPHCCPSRATFHSGLYPSRHGVWNNVSNTHALSRGLNDGVRLWSEDLAEADYDLAWAGKWHVSVLERPRDRGWRELGDHVSGHTPNEHGNYWQDYRKQAAEPEPTERGEGEILRPGYGTYRLYGTREAGNGNDERSCELAIEALPKLAGGDKPWALYIGCTGPHDPYYVPQRYLDLYDLDDVPLPESFADQLTDKPRIYQRMRQMRWDQLSEREIREGIRHFWAYCSYLDDLFGKVLTALDATGQAENTLVLYCADHADYCGEHGLFAKGIPCFRGAYHIPAVMRWPAGIAQPGRRVDALVSEADYAPTLTELAGVKTDRHFTGQSLMPFIRGEQPADWRDALFTQCNGVELYYTQRAVMTRDYKYVFNGFDMDELYDLRRDRNEMHNLAADPAMEPIKRQMCRRLWQFAHEEQDMLLSSYITVALAPYGPAEAFRS